MTLSHPRLEATQVWEDAESGADRTLKTVRKTARKPGTRRLTARVQELDERVSVARRGQNSERTGYLARFGQVRWHSPGREPGQMAARKCR